jgi:hypothetical protein
VDLNEFLNSEVTKEKSTQQKVNKDNYRKIVGSVNATSYSTLSTLHRCPRLFELQKIRASREEQKVSGNINFAFGHSVGAGVQEFISTLDAEKAYFQSFLAWNIPFEVGDEKSKKSIFYSNLAVCKFIQYWNEQDYDSIYEICEFVNMRGEKKKAVELSFALDCGNGYRHYGHIDLILKHKITGKLFVVELKTTGMRVIDSAMYANSSQAIGYSIILDAIAPGNSEYFVTYLSYSSSNMAWSEMQFNKSLSQRAGWIQDLLLDHANISTYRRLNFFPMRGENCITYSRPCAEFGSCQLSNSRFGINSINELREVSASQEAEEVDFIFNLENLL